MLYVAPSLSYAMTCKTTFGCENARPCVSVAVNATHCTSAGGGAIPRLGRLPALAINEES